MGPRVAACILLASGACLVMGMGTNPYFDESDNEALEKADVAAATYCADVNRLSAEERSGAREELLSSIGGNNPIEDALTESKSQDELAQNLQKTITVGQIISNGAALVMAILMAILWYFFCWTACPCCRCCRCCKRPRPCKLWMRIIVPVCLVGIIIGLIVCVILAGTAQTKTTDAISGTACTAGELLNSTLAGKGGARSFIGLVGVFDIFWSLENNLNNDSEFMNGLDDLITDTQPISDATYVAKRVMDLIERSMTAPTNAMPVDAFNADLYHDCEFCNQAAPIIGEVSGALTNGVGSALSNARGEIKKQFGPNQRSALKESIRGGVAPLENLKKTLLQTVAPITDVKTFDQIKGIVDTYLLIGMMAVFIITALLLFCACWSGIMFVFKNKGPETVKVEGAKKINPFYKTVSRCACCSWQWSFLYCILTFFLGGIIQAITWPVASVCLVLDGLSGEKFEEIAGPFSINTTDDAGRVLVSMVDQCLVPADPLLNANLFDIVTLPGENMTLRERLVGQVKDPINAQFDSINSTLGNQTIADSAGVLQLRDFFHNTDIRALILPNESRLAEAAYYSKFEEPLRFAATIASALCDNFTEIPGIHWFVSVLQTYGTLVDDPTTCADVVNCPVIADDACAAGNQYITNVKQPLLASNKYRCDLFEDPADPASECDPKYMAHLPNGVWVNDCLKADGTMTIFNKTCNLTELAAYMKDHDIRLQKIFERLDSAVASTFVKIIGGMKELVNEHFIGKIIEVADGLTCGLMADAYRGIVDALCFQGVIGLRRLAASYVGSAIIVFIMLFLMYGTWRNQIDQVNSWNQENMPKTTQVIPMEPNP